MWRRLRNFYPRPPRGGRPFKQLLKQAGVLISIHALREEGDQKDPFGDSIMVISIHALREEGDR